MDDARGASTGLPFALIPGSDPFPLPTIRPRSMSQPDALFLKLAVSKGLLSADLAQEIHRAQGRDGPPMRDLLLDRGLITTHIADNLAKEVERAQAPKVIGGHRLVAKIGKGGMGSVYRALQLSMDREVALKVIAREHLRDQAARDRFLREARVAGQVSHPNVITCHDAGQDGSVLYLAMELVMGGDLERFRKTHGGRVPQRRAVEIIRDCALGLQAIHEAGLLHRDIKPGNIFLSDSGMAKLADLGLARLQSGDDQMTSTGSTVGTPAFMSPEQADGSPALDIRSDIYALGATLFCLVTGRPPYLGNGAWAVVAAVIKEPFPNPLEIAPDLDRGLVRLLLKTCAKNRKDRYALPRDLARACQDLLASGTLPTDSPARNPLPGHVSSGTRPTLQVLWQSSLRTVPGRYRSFLRRTWGRVILAMSFLGLLVLGGGAAFHRDRPAAVDLDPVPPIPLPLPPELNTKPSLLRPGSDLLRILAEHGTLRNATVISGPDGLVMTAAAAQNWPRLSTSIPLPDEYDLEFDWTDESGKQRGDVGVVFQYLGGRTSLLAGVRSRFVRLGSVHVPLPETYRMPNARMTGRLLVRRHGLEARIEGLPVLRCLATDVRPLPADGTTLNLLALPSQRQVRYARLRVMEPQERLHFSASTVGVTDLGKPALTKNR